MTSNVDLSRSYISKFFLDRSLDGKIQHFIDKLDSADVWTVDFEKNSSDLSVIAEIEDLFNLYGKGLHIEVDKVLFILSSITTSRCLYLVNEISEKYPQLLDALELKIAELTQAYFQGDNLPPDIIKQRFDVMDRARLLDVIYSEPVYQRIFRLLLRA